MNNNTEFYIKKIESRFKEVSNLQHLDLSKFPIRKSDYEDQQQKTLKSASKERGYVTTPIFLVDIMIAMKYKSLSPELNSCDLCAGECGQFTIRLMRCLYNRYKIDVLEWLKNSHYLTELANDSCASLVYIYGPNINLFCGDSLNLSYSNEEDHGILFFDENLKIWKNNSLLDELIQYDVVKDSLKLLKFIFKNNADETKLLALKNKLDNL